MPPTPRPLLPVDRPAMAANKYSALKLLTSLYKPTLYRASSDIPVQKRRFQESNTAKRARLFYQSRQVFNCVIAVLMSRTLQETWHPRKWDLTEVQYAVFPYPPLGGIFQFIHSQLFKRYGRATAGPVGCPPEPHRQ